jgi:hypothetical protein
MGIYTVNIVTTTKNKEFYERVAVNEYPLVIHCENDDRLRAILTERVDYIRNILKTEIIYNHAVYMIREIIYKGFSYDIREFEWRVRDVTPASYSV